MTTPIRWIDSHAHLDGPDFDGDRAEVLERAKGAGVFRVVNIGATDGFGGAHRTRELVSSVDMIWGSVGIHPHDAALAVDIVQLRALAQHPKIVAIGETGLDFFRDWSPREGQYAWFEAQISLALELQKPLIIHSRSASEECLQILKDRGAERVGGVFHCYDQDVAFAARLREINFLVSVPGIVTFPKATALQETIRKIPLDQIMLETDSPFLAPVPYRGKRCESAYVAETARYVAELRGISLEEMSEQTLRTTCKFFQMPMEDA